MTTDLTRVLTQPRVSDGAWVSQLERLGWRAGSCPEECNIVRPELVRQAAAAFVAAGSHVVQTNTAGANRFALGRYGLADKAEAINSAGVEISRHASGGQAWVFGTMGPSGLMVLAKEVSVDELYKAFHFQARILVQGGVDAVLISGMTELDEAIAAVRAAKDAGGLPVVASMIFDTGAEPKTVMGLGIPDAAGALRAAGADLIGCNCGVSAEDCFKIVQAFRQQTDLPIWAKPDVGQPELNDGKVTYKQTPEEFTEKAANLFAAGANIVGGCCGAGPEHIARLALLVKSWQPAR